MHVFGALLVAFRDIDLFEVFDRHLHVSAGDLHVDDDLLLLGACEGIAVLLVGLESIGDQAVGCEFEFGELGLSVDDDFGLLDELEFQQEHASGARGLCDGGHLVG